MAKWNALELLSQNKALFAGIVTSLHFYNEEILIVGHGPFLKVYNVLTRQLLVNETVLESNRIHRIVPVVEHHGKYIVYGSKTIRYIQLREDVPNARMSLSVGPAYQLSDWIMDATQLITGELAVAFAHNQVEVYSVHDEKLVLIHKVQCEVRCILYSARFHGKTKQELMLGSGTVFNEVHLWNVFNTNEAGDGVVHNRLIGHEGVIFGVRFSEDGSMVSSVSDDRTIRVWPLAKQSTKPLVIWGHTARVWDCQFVDEYLVSISEDATCRVWRNLMITDPDNRDDMDCLACWEGHIGKNIWSCAISPEKKIVATGGQDSGIRLWSLVSIKNNNIESEDDLALLSLPEAKKDSTFIRNFSLTDWQTIVAATNDGSFLKLQNSTWTTLYEGDQDFANYTMMESSPCGTFVVAGSVKGQLLVLSPAGQFEPIKISAHQQKVFEIFIEPSSTDPSLFYIMSTGYNEAMLFHRLVLNNSNPTIQTLYTIEFPRERTTAIATAISEKNRILFLGSRESALIIYELPLMFESSETVTLQPISPMMQLRKSHGKEAVSSVTIRPNKDSEEDGVINFWTTGRDGAFIQYRLTRRQTPEEDQEKEQGIVIGIASQGDTVVTSRDWVLEKVYRNKVTKGWLEESIWIEDELLLLGFYRKRFFVYNETKNYEMISVACGGAHRRWQFRTKNAKLDLATFMFIRKEQLYAYFRDGTAIHDGFEETILQENFDGRDVRSVRFLDVSSNVNEKPLLFATGGEDTLLKIHQVIHSPAPHFVTLAHIRKHTSVIKSIEGSKGIDDLLFTSGANQDLRCWKLELLSAGPGGLVGINCLEWASCPSVSEVIETRIMDLTVHAINPGLGLHLVGAGYSDSTIRVWLFNEATRRFSLLADGSWHTRCILQMKHLVIPGRNGESDRILFFTTATDGRVAIWDINNNIRNAINSEDIDMLESDPTRTATKFTQPICFYRPHQSGVNGLAVALKGDTILVVSGGEDNAMASAKLRIAGDGTILPVGNPHIIRDAHGSSITAVEWTKNGERVLSVSTDQRLNMWDLEDDGEQGVRISMVDAAFVDVPDPSAMGVTIYNDKVYSIVSGIGLEGFIF
ncbi:WD40-repeat-containing domain protein [Dichotomocladium elegans]|nr:WD40-repeat-containing domain protein [Dichotomocladium elegans]